MEIGQFFNIKNKTGMKNNDIRNIDKKIKFTTGRCGLGNLSDIAPIRITVPIVVTISKKPLGSCFGISSSLPSMVRNFPSVKVTLEKYLTARGTPIRVVQAQIKAGVGYAFPNLRVINPPRTIPIPNMRFQKLDLFIRESQKVLFGCLVKLRDTISTLGSIASALTCLGFVSMLKGLVKSRMSVISNYEFNISVIIVSGIRLLSKEITAVNSCFLSLVLYSVTICNFLTTSGNYYES
jgi:hypothetical protein